MESPTAEAFNVCSLCKIGTEHYYVIQTRITGRIVICSDCILDQFDYLMGIITPKMRSKLMNRLRTRM